LFSNWSIKSARVRINSAALMFGFLCGKISYI
jgi:hypothetical protein